jgi:hypothetical protein
MRSGIVLQMYEYTTIGSINKEIKRMMNENSSYPLLVSRVAAVSSLPVSLFDLSHILM